MLGIKKDCVRHRTKNKELLCVMKYLFSSNSKMLIGGLTTISFSKEGLSLKKIISSTKRHKDTNSWLFHNVLVNDNHIYDGGPIRL